ncbi:transposase [Streptococcus pneumoniae]|nr:transposase [Streptococcus pneumoniae]
MQDNYTTKAKHLTIDSRRLIERWKKEGKSNREIASLEKFFGLIEDNLKQVHPIFQTVFKTFLKNKEKIVNALQLPYSNAKLEATNNLIKLIKRNAFGFRNFENFKKRIFIALNIKKERTKFVLSRA